MRRVGVLSHVTIEVDDVAAGRDFWSSLTGLTVADQNVGAGWATLAPAELTQGGPSVGLRRSPSAKAATSPNRGHVDITVADVDVAVAQVLQLGGRLKVGPALYPRPLSPADGEPVIDWAVVTDPSGNEFCVIRDLEEVEQQAVRASDWSRRPVDDSSWNQRTLRGRYDDALWRRIARSARTGTDDPVAAPPVATPADPVGELRCCVINVDDLAVALHFWSALVGVGPIVSEWPFRFAYLGDEDETSGLWKHQLILQRAGDPARDDPDRVHYDITVDDLSVAEAQVRWMGGLPGATTSEAVLLGMHAHERTSRLVMRDRSGNSFCLVQRA